MSSIASPRERFLRVFEGDVRNNLISFGQRLWEHDSDIFIFMARKAACFHECMRELDLADVRGIPVNDRVLDMDLSWMKGKRVTLVDDCVFTGTTIYNAIEQVRAAGCLSVDTLALAVNTDTIRQQLMPGGIEWDDLRIASPVFTLPNNDCVKQCYDIVRAISIMPRPYDVDFPQSVTAKVKEGDFDRIVNVDSWTSFDVSSDFQRSHDVLALSLIPTSSVHRHFFSVFGGRPGPNGSIKIRIYARRLSSGSWSVRMMPVVMLPPLLDTAVFESLSNSCDPSNRHLLSTLLTTPRARYRALQFLAAESFLSYFIREHIPTVLPEGIAFRTDLADLSFGPGGAKKMQMLWPAPNSRTFMALDPQPSRPCPKGFDPMPVTVDNAAEASRESVEPFSWLFQERELDAREQVRKHGLKHEKTQSSVNINRLGEGFSPDFLVSRIQCHEVDSVQYASSLLDRLVDIGIAVPTVVQRQNVCCREFRHGEDAIFSEAQERMALQALQQYLLRQDTDSVWGLELQKFLVLFIQIGLRQDLLDRLNFLTAVPVGATVLSVKGYLHGPIPTVAFVSDPSGDVGPPFIDGYRHKPTSLLKHWLRKGYLKREHESRGTKYSIGTIPRGSIGEVCDIRSRKIGSALGAARKHGLITADRDLVLLSTCAEPDQQLRALAGELAIFSDRWSILSKRVREHTRLQHYTEARRMLRSDLDVFVAVNSGARKYDWYVKGEFQELIRTIADSLRTSNHHSEADEWILLWGQRRTNDATGSPFISDTIRRSGRWLIILNAAMRLLDYWLLLSDKHMHPDSKLHEQRAMIDDLKGWCRRADKAFGDIEPWPLLKVLRSVASDIGSETDSQRRLWCEEAGTTMNTFASTDAREILEDITQICNAYGACKPERSYPYAIYIDIPEAQSGDNHYLASLIHANTASETNGSYHILGDHLNPWRSGIWAVFSGNHNSRTAIQCIHAITNQLASAGRVFRAALIGQLDNRDCIRSFSYSTQLGYGFFFRRVSDLTSHLLSDSFDCTIRVASDHGRQTVSEFAKFVQEFPVLGKQSVPKIVQAKTAAGDTIEVEVGVISVPVATPHSSLSPSSVEDIAGQRPVRVLLCTATDTEDDALREHLAELDLAPSLLNLPGNIYRQCVLPTGLQIFMVRSEMGSAGSGGASATVSDAIRDVSPDYVISCGLAFGRDAIRQQIGQVLVSEWIRSYDQGRQSPGHFLPRGQRTPADARLVQLARAIRERVDLRMSVGGILSGSKLIDDPAFKNSIWDIEPEAIGGDMEGAGVVDACHRAHVGWVVVKAICDWAENKHSKDQALAARNAVAFVMAMLRSEMLTVR